MLRENHAPIFLRLCSRSHSNGERVSIVLVDSIGTERDGEREMLSSQNSVSK